MGVMEGKRGLVMGVANDRSLAYGIARALRDEGAEMMITYQGEAFGKRAEPLANDLGGIALDVDVTDPASMDRMMDALTDRWQVIDFAIHAIGFTDKAEMAADFKFRDTSKENYKRTMEISAWSLIDLGRRVAPHMQGGGSIITLTFEGSNRVTPCYNVMGAAKAALEANVKYLAADLGPEGIRVNAISPGPMKTLAGSAIGGARRTYKHTEANAPMGSNATLETVGGTAVWLASDWGAMTSGEIIRVDGGYHVMGMPRLENL